MTATPLVSIVTPSFNKGRYLEATVRSVIEQDYPNIEYLVMDGGSDDGSLEILRRYEHRIAFWTSGPDGGQSAAVTAGWQRSHGDIVAELDASDVLAPGSVRRAVDAMARHPEWAMLFGDSAWIDEQGKTIREVRARAFDVGDMLCGNYIAQPTVFLRRSCLERVGYYRPEFQMSMDFDLWMRVGREFPVGYLAGEVLGMMRMHEDSKSATSSRLWLDENVRVIDQTLGFGPWRLQRRHLRPSAVGCALARHAGYCVREGRISEARRTLWRMLLTGSFEPWRRYGRDLPYIVVHSFLGRSAAEWLLGAKRMLRDVLCPVR